LEGDLEMVDLRNQRRVASTLLKCGVHRVWIDPNRSEDVAFAVTRDDVRNLIKSGSVRAKQKAGSSKGRIRFANAQRKKGKRKGQGSRKGAKYARFPKKRRWISTIRPIRRQLCEFRDQNIIEKNVYRKYYLYSKGGMFKNKGHLVAHLKAENLLKAPSKTQKVTTEKTTQTKKKVKTKKAK
jgi:large subunit ribosomal protein L19e